MGAVYSIQVTLWPVMAVIDGGKGNNQAPVA